MRANQTAQNLAHAEQSANAAAPTLKLGSFAAHMPTNLPGQQGEGGSDAAHAYNFRASQNNLNYGTQGVLDYAAQAEGYTQQFGSYLDQKALNHNAQMAQADRTSLGNLHATAPRNPNDVLSDWYGRISHDINKAVKAKIK
jgi:hypothetical protein